MKKIENKMGTNVTWLMLAVVGFMLLIFDQHIVVGFLNGIYPAFQESYEVGTEFQLYTLQYTYGMHADIYESAADGYMSMINLAYNIRLDIFPDILGYVLIAVSLSKLSKLTKIFKIAAMTAVAAIVFSVIILLLPFFFNGGTLAKICFWFGIAQFGIDTCMGYVFVYGLCDLLSGYQYLRDRKALGISWFATVVVNCVVMVLSWLSLVISPALLTTYNMLDLAVNFLFFYFIYKNREYIVGDRKV